MAGRDWFFRIRVTLLLAILAIVGLYAWNDVRSRQARTRWEKPVTVGLVFLRLGPVDPQALAQLSARSKALEDRLAAEYQRYRPNAGERMIQLVSYGPIDIARAPETGTGDSFWDRTTEAFALWRYTRAVDQRADVPSQGLDSRIYMIAEPKKTERQGFVEGFSQSGGRIGFARVELATDMIDLALFVATHELFHTLGASDKYDSLGRTRVPEGLAAPERVPLFPQPGADVMARNRMLAPHEEAPPETLDQLWVGPTTAREIGWLR